MQILITECVLVDMVGLLQGITAAAYMILYTSHAPLFAFKPKRWMQSLLFNQLADDFILILNKMEGKYKDEVFMVS